LNIDYILQPFLSELLRPQYCESSSRGVKCVVGSDGELSHQYVWKGT